MLPFRSLLCVTIMLAVIPVPPARSHHSRANFELDVVTELEGEITEFSWRNPHTFARLLTIDESGQEVEWLLELNSISVLTRWGWSRDSLAVGDRVRVTGNRDLNYDKRFLFSNYFYKEDGSVLASSPLEGDPIRTGAPRAARAQPPAQLEKAGSIFGAWQLQNRGGPGNRLGGGGPGGAGGMAAGGRQAALTGDFFGPARGVPVTASGQAAIDAFNEAVNPEFRCEDSPAPGILRRGPMRIEQVGNEIHFYHQRHQTDRVVYLDPVPESERIPTYHGYSAGTLANGVLSVEMTHFSTHPWGNARGVPSGEQKHVTATYSLIDDGTRLQLEFRQEDPEYLTEAITGTAAFLLAPGGELVEEEFDCDPEASSRHLTLE